MFIFIKSMKIAFNNFNVLNKVAYSCSVKKNCSENLHNKEISFNGLSYNSHSSLKPLTYSDKMKLDEMSALSKLMKDEKGKFSLEKAAELIKDKTDKQLMLYSENDIKQIVKTVISENPGTTREEVLSVLARISNFSNYESLSQIEKFAQKEKIQSFMHANELTLDNIFNYLKTPHKMLLNLSSDNLTPKQCIMADRNIVRCLKAAKEKRPEAFQTLINSVKYNNTVIVLPDGWEAKTKDGYKSFNIVGAWGDLASAASAVIKEQKSGTDPFNEDLVSDLKNLFGDDVKINIVKNSIENPNEKDIAERLNGKSISKEEIKSFLKAVSLYGTPSSDKPSSVQDFNLLMSNREIDYNRKLSSLKNGEASKKEVEKYKYSVFSTAVKPEVIKEKDKLTVQEELAKIIYCTMNVYSPRRIASELKLLYEKIKENAEFFGKTPDDALYILYSREKSYGLINYQYSKVNNIRPGQIVYINDHETKIDPSKKNGKFFVCLDDFSGSGQSLVDSTFVYSKFRLRNPYQPYLFAPMAYSKQALDRINKEIFSAKINLRQRAVNDCLIGATQVEDTDDYLKLLSANKKRMLRFCFNKGYKKSSVVVAFPHVVPDNCSDTIGLLMERFLTSKKANKAKIKPYKKELIEYLINSQNN